MYENIYYTPEAFGLTIVDSIDYSSGSYEFDMRVVWKDKKGKKYTARDSGCSCPTPFEDYGSIDKLDKFNFKTIRDEAQNMLKQEYGCYVTPAQVQEFLEKIK